MGKEHEKGSRGEALRTLGGACSVCPHHRRKGVARQLISSLEERARKREVELLKELVQTENLGSRRLVESLGYEHRATLYGEFKSARFGEIDDGVYYKRLVPCR
jgi:ribosomal protein S18 acetylase RimI-like enzyme